MAKYFFDAFDGVEHHRDEYGSELDSREAARLSAQTRLGDMSNRALPDGHRREFIVDVRDALGILIYTCRLSFVGRWLDYTVPPLNNRAGATEK
ncbi:DUF6894 family protein [Pararoseomonas indoligenes]|uniref:DUF6894 family protein n=1 Tax=Roseomonas indoligenes TaxID=2820811 RepID=UPI0038D1445D